MELGLRNDEVKLTEHNPDWAKLFALEKAKIMEMTGLAAERIGHIGSTAIPGILAKPLIDIVVGVDDLSEVDDSMYEQLQEIGFYRLKVERPGEIILAKFTDGTFQVKTHFIHLTTYEGTIWENFILFRNYLIRNESARQAYESIKRDFVDGSNSGITAYTNEKEDFVKNTLEKARAEQ
ncbi:MAG TPA: GrpB family protein [Pseudogracilibacillus sp.]|nr:GrpB family protein [Pseudogracilibacillus sp.]